MHTKDTKKISSFVFFVSFVVIFYIRKAAGKLQYSLLILDGKTHMAFIQAHKIVADAD